MGLTSKQSPGDLRACLGCRQQIAADMPVVRCNRCGYLYVDWLKPAFQGGRWQWLVYPLTGILCVSVPLAICAFYFYGVFENPKALTFWMPRFNTSEISERIDGFLFGVVFMALGLFLAWYFPRMFRSGVWIERTHVEWRERYWRADQIVPWRLIHDIKLIALTNPARLILDLGEYGAIEVPQSCLRSDDVEETYAKLRVAWQAGRYLTVEDVKAEARRKKRKYDEDIAACVDGAPSDSSEES